MVEAMLVLSRPVTRRVRNVGRGRQLTGLCVSRRGLRVVAGGNARSVASVVDNAEPTTTTTTGGKPTFAPSAVHDPAREKIDTMFDNAREAYTSKTNFELLRGYAVFQMCSIRPIVNKNKQV